MNVYFNSKSMSVSLSQIPGSSRCNSFEVTKTESISPSGNEKSLIIRIYIYNYI